jgi:hypothetical protein
MDGVVEGFRFPVTRYYFNKETRPMIWSCPLLVIALGLSAVPECDIQEEVGDLPRLVHGKVGMQNALWIEDDPANRFAVNKRVVIADIKGPAAITMLHFALPGGRKITRDVLLKITWDGEKEPSVDCPLVDFFCDPAGLRNDVNTILVNKRQGYNAYFPMPFRRSAKIELVYDGPLPPGDDLVLQTPAYFYAMYRTAEKIPDDAGYFHATWRQESLPLGKRDYLALDARGKGKFVGWNVTVRLPGGETDYSVDENEKFFVDGEKKASVEFEGLEDSFGFSWGFPESQSFFPRTGYFPFFKGAAAYRFFLQDAISFDKSLRVVIGFGPKDLPLFHEMFAKPRNMMQFSSTVYWYQQEPHAAWTPLPPAAGRAPAPEKPLWLSGEKLPSPTELNRRGVKLLMLCGRPEKEVVHAEHGFDAEVKSGYAYAGWDPPVYHCRADEKEVQIELSVPPKTVGKLRLFAVDPDRFRGGRKQTVQVAGKPLGAVENFAAGRWLECEVSPEQTKDGKVLIQATNTLPGANAVISIVEWNGK